MKQYEFSRTWIDGYADWILYWINKGWIPFYVNIMFSPLITGPADSLSNSKHSRLEASILGQIKSIIEMNFYPRLAGLFTRHPKHRREHDRLPKMILFPDKSVAKKHKKLKLERVVINETLHYNGVLLAPPVSRLKGGLIEVVQRKQDLFRGAGVERFHVEPLDYTPRRCVAYTVKTVRHGRASEEDIIALPRVQSEVTDSTGLLDPKERLIKDIISSTNLSEAVIRNVTARRPLLERTY